jgi:hypothetical protein
MPGLSARLAPAVFSPRDDEISLPFEVSAEVESEKTSETRKPEGWFVSAGILFLSAGLYALALSGVRWFGAERLTSKPA